MNYTNINNFSHGIMFHHFHDQNKHLQGQGSISKDKFYKLIKFIGRNNILYADNYIEKFKKKKLRKSDVCFTFDDGLKCQYDIALPILDELKIKSFFFITSSIFTKKPDLLEVFRYFRINYFKDIEEFYLIFFQNIDNEFKDISYENIDEFSNLKKLYPFYSDNDVKFRIIRDLMGKTKYFNSMNYLFKKYDFDPQNYYEKLFINKKDLNNLIKLEHKIGLHSHNHPTNMNELSYVDQKNEYSKNRSELIKIINNNKFFFNSASHPLGKFNNNTFKVLRELNIDIAFIDNISSYNLQSDPNFCYRIPREDHTNIFKFIK